MSITLRWVLVPAESVPATTVPLATKEVWRNTGMGYVKEMGHASFYKL
jgi:hypothetical protein